MHEKRRTDITAIKALCGSAKIISEKAIQFDSMGGDHLETSLAEIESWISEL
jgi:hypothetical protein